MSKTKMVWKRHYEEDEMDYTEDSVLWVNGKPTNVVISGWTHCWWLYINHKQVFGPADTKQECKDYYMEKYGIKAQEEEEE